MKSILRITIFCIVGILTALHADAINLNGIVLNPQGNMPVPGVNISIFSADSLICNFDSDKTGKFSFSLLEGNYRVQASKENYYTLQDTLIIRNEDEGRELRLLLEKEAVTLDEFVVKGRTQYVKNTKDGVIYNLSRDKYAQENNLLNALNRVPLLMVSSDGAINVAGKSSYLIYLNDKPYPIANAEPAQVLKSIPASSIKDIEVITKPAQRFGETSPIINIVTKGNSLDGYHVNLNGMGATTPKATGAGSILGIVNKVQFFAGYTYDFWGQRDQYSKYEFEYGNVNRQTIISEKNHYDRHIHEGRAMFQWSIDSIRQLYADFYLTGMKRNTRQVYEDSFYPDSPDNKSEARYLSMSDTWEAAMEANILYSSFFKEKKNSLKWRFGYRFTINPDDRDYQITDLDMNSLSFSKTHGKLYTHNFQIYRRINISDRLISLLTLNANGRYGKALSYYQNEASAAPDDDFRYTQILGSINWDLFWYVTKNKELWFKITNKIEYSNDDSSELDTRRQDVVYYPAAKLTWEPNWNNEFILAFYSNVNRPSLQMLNPFTGGETENDVTQGSPLLKNSRSYSLSLEYAFYSKKLMISPKLTGSLIHNALMREYHSNQTLSGLIETYCNITKMKSAILEIFISYRPFQWLTLRNVSTGGYQNIVYNEKGLDQSDWYYRSTSVATFNLPESWQIEASFSAYKNTPTAWLRYKPGCLYSFSVSKTFMKGNMLVKLFTDKPFNKHGVSNSRTILTSPEVTFDKLWKIQSRSVGLEISVNFRGGKKVGLKRDTSLRDTDISTGISK